MCILYVNRNSLHGIYLETCTHFNVQFFFFFFFYYTHIILIYRKIYVYLHNVTVTVLKRNIRDEDRITRLPVGWLKKRSIHTLYWTNRYSHRYPFFPFAIYFFEFDVRDDDTPPCQRVILDLFHITVLDAFVLIW